MRQHDSASNWSRRRDLSSGKAWGCIGIAGGAFIAAVFVATVVDDRVRELFAETLSLAVACCLLAVPTGVALASVIVRSDLPWRRAAAVTLLVLLFIPLYLQAAAWDAGFGRQGWLSVSRGSLATPMLSGWWAAAWIHSVALVPWVVLLVGLALRYCETEFEEAALLEAGPWSVFWRVTLWRIVPAIGVASLWIALNVSTEMAVTDLYQVRTLAEQIYLEARLGDDALPWPSMLLAVGLFAGGGFAVAAALAPVSGQQLNRGQALFLWGGYRFLAAAVIWGGIALLVVVPLANLAVNAGIEVTPVPEGRPERSWELEKLFRVVAGSPRRFGEEIAWTLLLGGLAATFAVLVAAPLAWWACRRRLGAAAALLVSGAGLAIPAPLVGVALIWLLNRDFDFSMWIYDRTIFAPVVAAVIRASPLAILISWYSLRSIDRDALELAAVEGAGVSTQFTSIGLGQRWTAVAASWLAAAALAMGDLSTTILVAPPGMSTVSLRVFGLLHAGVDDQVAGLCLTIVVLYFGLGLATLAVVSAATRVRAS